MSFEDIGADLANSDFKAEQTDYYCTKYKENCYKCPKGKIIRHKYIKDKHKVICKIDNEEMHVR